jgi:8-oxo-dGTP pyrophosphatase MutT (NUDIX family)
MPPEPQPAANGSDGAEPSRSAGKGRPPGKDKKPGKGRAVRERSAGILVYRDTPAGREYLLLDYGRHWDYPKGHLEDDEDDDTAARRELREETGISRITLLPDFKHEITYLFRSSRKGVVHKTVAFFCGRLDPDEETVTLSHEHVGYAWELYDAAMQRLTFENARGVLRAAEAVLRERS